MADKKERTYVMIKPDALQRSLVGELIGRIERTGFKLIGIKMVRATEDQLWKHYDKDDEWFLAKGEKRVELMKQDGQEITKEPIEYGKDIIRGNIAFMTASPLICMVWQGANSVAIVKKLVGGTEPTTSDVGTIRGDYTLDSYSVSDTDGRALRNLIHCSDKVSEAEREIPIWFKEEELHDYRHIAEEILYDVNLDGIRE